MSSEYEPIPCALHSEYERLVLTGTTVKMHWEDTSGQSLEQTVRARDLYTRAGEEFLVVETQTGQRLAIRLDRIRDIRT